MRVTDYSVAVWVPIDGPRPGESAGDFHQDRHENGLAVELRQRIGAIVEALDGKYECQEVEHIEDASHPWRLRREWSFRPSNVDDVVVEYDELSDAELEELLRPWESRARLAVTTISELALPEGAEVEVLTWHSDV